MAKKKQPFQYGKDAAPKDWFEAASAVDRSTGTGRIKPKHSGPSLMDRITALEAALKAKQEDGN